MKTEKVRLTESGAAALKTWMEGRGVSLAALGEATRTHVMWSRRLLLRQGLATLEQVGLLVAFAAGELTAGQLIGLELAPQVPQLQAIGVPPAAGQGPPQGPAHTGPVLARPQPVAFEVGKGTRREILERAIQQTRGETARAKLLLQLLKLDEEEESKRGDGDALVTDLELVRRFEDLLYHCQRSWVEADDAARAAEAEAAKAGGGDHG